MKKNNCPCCSTVGFIKKMVLKDNYYECGCGYAVMVTAVGEIDET